jgi:hypothetical protein
MNLLALTTEAEVQELLKKSSPAKYEFGLLFTSLGLVTLLVLVWAIFIRKQKGESSRRYSYHRSREEVSKSAAPAAPTAPQTRHRKRRRRHRRRNPTLAETGGLPPVRTEPFAGDPP